MICPVCGKGHIEIFGNQTVSHLACVEKLEQKNLQLKADVADAVTFMEQAEAELAALWTAHSKHHPSCEDCGEAAREAAK